MYKSPPTLKQPSPYLLPRKPSKNYTEFICTFHILFYKQQKKSPLYIGEH